VIVARQVGGVGKEHVSNISRADTTLLDEGAGSFTEKDDHLVKCIVRVIVAARQTLTSGYERPRDEIIVRVIVAARQTLTSGYERPRSLSQWVIAAITLISISSVRDNIRFHEVLCGGDDNPPN